MTERLPARPVEPPDLDELLRLCGEHAAYEKADRQSECRRDALAAALFGTPPELLGWVVGESRDLLGYATATVEFSTWTAARFLHMDCLFVRETQRGLGIGQQLFDAVTAAATARGIQVVQWQTPQWNTEAQRFYDRSGAKAAPKQRYTLRLPSIR